MAFEIRNGILIHYLPEESAETVTVPAGVTEIGRNAFYDCRCLKEIRLPEGLRVIRKSAFNGCSALREICIPETVTEIGENAFYHCKELGTVILPAHLTHIGSSAFRRTRLEREFPDELIVLGEWLIRYRGKAEHAVIPETVRHIADGAFAFSSIRTVTFPPRLEQIGERAFMGCPLEELSFPETLRYIGERAFYRCDRLKQIVFAGDVPAAGTDAFALHAKVHTVTVRGKQIVLDGYYRERRWENWLCFGVDTILSPDKYTFGHIDYVSPDKCRMGLEFYRFSPSPQLRTSLKEGMVSMFAQCLNNRRTDVIALLLSVPELLTSETAERIWKLSDQYAQRTGALEVKMLVMRALNEFFGTADTQFHLE